MPRCLKCGKKGFFLLLNESGLCRNCALESGGVDRRLADWTSKKQSPAASLDARIETAWSWYRKRYHDRPEQLLRQDRIFNSTTPVIMSTEHLDAFFLSTDLEKIYHTTLRHCTCPDFVGRRAPCKHMYRLYNDLINRPGVVPEITDPNADITDRFFSLDDSNRVHFLATYCILDRGDKPVQMITDSATKAEIQAGLLIGSEELDYSVLLNKMLKDEIILALAKKRVSGFAPSWTKAKLINWIIETQPKFLSKQYKNYSAISIDPFVKEWTDGIKKSYALRNRY